MQAVVILSAASCHAGLLGAGTGEANTTRFVIKDFVLTFSSGEGSCAAAPFRLLFIPKLLLSLQSKMFLLLVYKIQLSLQSKMFLIQVPGREMASRMPGLSSLLLGIRVTTCFGASYYKPPFGRLTIDLRQPAGI